MSQSRSSIQIPSALRAGIVGQALKSVYDSARSDETSILSLSGVPTMRSVDYSSGRSDIRAQQSMSFATTIANRSEATEVSMRVSPARGPSMFQYPSPNATADASPAASRSSTPRTPNSEVQECVHAACMSRLLTSSRAFSDFGTAVFFFANFSLFFRFALYFCQDVATACFSCRLQCCRVQVRALRSHMGSISSQSQVLVQQLYHAKSELKRLQSLHLNQVEALRSDLEVARLNAVRSEAELVKLRPAVRSREAENT